jgi:hypothetical protein
VSVHLPADVAKNFEHHARLLGVTPLELASLALRMVSDPHHLLAVARRLTESDAERARREAKHRRMAKAAVDAVLSGRA